jgi:putative hydrolase of the HAD superfamily
MNLAIFVDLDGTLVDYDTAVRHATHDFVLTNHAWRNVDPDAFAGAWLTSRRNLTLDGTVPLDHQRTQRLKVVAANLDVECDDLAAARWARAITEAAVARCRTYPDVLEFLDAAGPVGIITNGDQAVQEAKLTAAGLTPSRFGPIVASMTVGHTKPSPAIFRFAAAARATRPDGCAMIGDSQRTDVDAAVAAGFARAALVDRSSASVAGAHRTLSHALTAIVTTVGSIS